MRQNGSHEITLVDPRSVVQRKRLIWGSGQNSDAVVRQPGNEMISRLIQLVLDFRINYDSGAPKSGSKGPRSRQTSSSCAMSKPVRPRYRSAGHRERGSIVRNGGSRSSSRS